MSVGEGAYMQHLTVLLVYFPDSVHLTLITLIPPI